MDRAMQGAVDRGCYLDVNAQPDRLDLNDAGCRHAKEFGLKVVVSEGAQTVAALGLIRVTLDQARRGWLEPTDVLNSVTLPQVLKCCSNAVSANWRSARSLIDRKTSFNAGFENQRVFNSSEEQKNAVLSFPQ